MPIYGRVMEISTLSGTPYTYVLLHLWPTKAARTQGDEPSGDNQFVMDLYKTLERVVKDTQGRYKTLEGEFVHPDRATGDEVWEVEHYKVDVAAEIKANIEDYLNRRRKLEGTKSAFPAFHARPAMVGTQDDPRGILAMSDVQKLVGGEITSK